MPTILTKKATFKANNTYHICCEYCEHIYSVKFGYEKETTASSVGRTPPSTESLVATAEKEFHAFRDRVIANANRKIFLMSAKDARCPQCGFLPTYMIKRTQTIWLILGLLFVVGPAIVLPFAIPGSNPPPPSIFVIFGLFCWAPFLAVLWLLFRQLSPNRKLMKELKAEGRTLAQAQPARIEFGRLMPKL